MNVLQVSKFYPPVRGGIESTAFELTEGLNRSGWPTDVLCANLAPRTCRQRFATGYDVVRAASLGTLLSTSMAPAMIGLLLRMAPRYDVVHVHMPDPMAALAIWFARPRARLVLHWHSDVIRQRLALRVYEPLQRWLLQRADAVVATSQAYVDTSSALQPFLDKVRVIPIGISDNHSQACSVKAEAIRRRFHGRRLVFALGRMTYYKGFDVLIDAAAMLPVDCAVLVGGGGELLDDYRSRVARRGLAGKVHFVGPIEGDDLPSHFEACDVFCLPSTGRSEAYGLAMLEAMAMAKPVVAADITGSGVPWVNVHEQTGLNVPSGRPVPLAEALTRLLRDPALRQRLGTASRERFVEQFSAALMTRRVIDLYRAT